MQGLALSVWFCAVAGAFPWGLCSHASHQCYCWISTSEGSTEQTTRHAMFLDLMLTCSLD